jgi:hypothetical protein
MSLQYLRNSLALLARQAALGAVLDPAFKDIADALYTACVACKVPEELLPR